MIIDAWHEAAQHAEIVHWDGPGYYAGGSNGGNTYHFYRVGTGEETRDERNRVAREMGLGTPTWMDEKPE